MAIEIAENFNEILGAALAKHERYQRLNGWIPADEQTPPKYEKVLIWYEYLHYSKNQVLPEYGIGYYTEYGTWSGDAGSGTDVKVLYWRDLPDPPEEE